MITKPKIPIDLEKVRELAAHGQSQGQIAINLGIAGQRFKTASAKMHNLTGL